jgi:potassium-transporting ATPase KdpC subunit
MKNHLRANLALFTLIVPLVCIAYPTAIWLYANCLFPANAAGSLITKDNAGGNQTVQGSRLIAQPFTKPWYFQPRPSAPLYNATASGGSNYGANNPRLRDRVARQLGPLVKYDLDSLKRDDSVQKDIEAWFTGYQPELDQDPLMVQWAKSFPTLAVNWVKDDANRPAVVEWLRRHPEILDKWKESHPDAELPDLNDEKATIPFDDIATAFFVSVAATEEYVSPKRERWDRNRWLESKEYDTGSKDGNGKPVMGKQFKPTTEGIDLQATFFDMWLQAHPDVVLQKVPADMVTASGSGLDPHITLRNANYQLQGVVAARAAALNRPPTEVRPRIEAILKDFAFVPLSGMIGEPLVNVLEVNMELDKQLPIPSAPTPAAP